MTFSVIVPTKNRPKELRIFLTSLWGQSKLPDQLIVIDQSHQSNVIEPEVLLMADKLKVSLAYVHDESIKGLVQAKAVSLTYNQCDIISFFDDDIVLEENYIEAIEKAFIKNAFIKGANGVILNALVEGRFKRWTFNITHFGVFKDNRRTALRKVKNNDKHPKRLNTLSGGLASFRKDVFSYVPFDDKNLFHAYEDKEHSARFRNFFLRGMYLIPSARLYHNHAAQNRESLLKKTKTDVIEVWKLFKKNGDYSLLGFDLIILLLGLFLNACLLSIKHKNRLFVYAYFKGLSGGIKEKNLK